MSFLRNNGLSLVLFFLFYAGFAIGQVFTGLRESNRERAAEGEPPEQLTEYLRGDHFLEATMENWESEFLQMGLFVWLTVFLYQKGSAESKDPDSEEEVDRDPRHSRNRPDAPWPVRRGGLVLKLYENSLSLAFALLFVISFLLHAKGGVGEFNGELAATGQPPITYLEYFGTSRFWFESFQNWQSEFLAIFAMVVLSIWLRQKGSPESKPVAAPHHQTGG
jgi:hypothetical protein